MKMTDKDFHILVTSHGRCSIITKAANARDRALDLLAQAERREDLELRLIGTSLQALAESVALEHIDMTDRLNNMLERLGWHHGD